LVEHSIIKNRKKRTKFGRGQLEVEKRTVTGEV